MNNPTEYAGDWSCGPEVPLGQDSTLLAYGYGASLRLPGTWRVSEDCRLTELAGSSGVAALR